MFAIIILLILAWSFYIGYSRGIVLQGYYAAMTIVSMLVAGALYQDLAKSISLWVPYASAVKGSSTYFFASSQIWIRFFMQGWLTYLSSVLSLVYIVGRFFGIFVNLIPYPNKWDTKVFNMVSGAIAVFISLFVIEMGLTILATVPMSFTQERLNSSLLIRFIINHTPVTSSILHDLWVTKIIG